MTRRLFRSFFLVLFLYLPAHSDSGFLPSAHEVFKPLQADPRELQYALRVVLPVSHKLFGEAAIGDYLGLYRWTLANGAMLQVSGGGGMFGRFDLADTSNDMQTVDFFGNVPLDFRQGKWSGRFMLFHTSSHLGDDFVKTTGRVIQKHSWDNLRWVLAYNPLISLRLYGGYTYAFRTLPEGIGRNAFQGGAEWSSGWWDGGHAQTYWANDFQSWGRAAWKPMFNSQLGVKFAQDTASERAVAFFLEFGAGRQAQGQFFLQQETHWVSGVKFFI